MWPSSVARQGRQRTVVPRVVGRNSSVEFSHARQRPLCPSCAPDPCTRMSLSDTNRCSMRTSDPRFRVRSVHCCQPAPPYRRAVNPLFPPNLAAPILAGRFVTVQQYSRSGFAPFLTGRRGCFTRASISQLSKPASPGASVGEQ